jgi:anti-sigma regulatory factor (Ser/Thr protein kinase)
VEALTEATHRRHPVRVEEDVGALRRAVGRMAAGCEGVRAGDAELAATELATNLVRHAAGGGYVLYRRANGGIELIAVDSGPGMRGSPLSRGGLGVGLGVVQRLASSFDLYSTEGWGSVVLARLAPPRDNGASSVRWGGVNVPLAGAGTSGDAWAVSRRYGAIAAVMVDGLGHGDGAHQASSAAVAVFRERPPGDLPAFVRRAHEAMRGTRGGVLGACLIDAEAGRLTYAGVGNVAARVVLGAGSRSLPNRAGTLGTQVAVPQVRVVSADWQPGATVLMASDGLRSGWDPLAYPRLLAHDPAVVAAVLHRDHQRGTDDATVLVLQDRRRWAG